MIFNDLSFSAPLQGSVSKVNPQICGNFVFNVPGNQFFCIFVAPNNNFIT